MRLFLLFIISSFTGFGQRTDFSGSWTINKTKIQFGEAPEWVLPKGFTVVQNKNTISIERILLDEQMKEYPFTEVLNYNGADSVNTTSLGTKKTTSLKWNGDGNTFVLTSRSVKANYLPGNSTVETWSLEDDHTLVIDRHVEQADGSKYDIKAYYEKK